MLFGFVSNFEKEVFEFLMSVSGVGPKFVLMVFFYFDVM